MRDEIEMSSGLHITDRDVHYVQSVRSEEQKGKLSGEPLPLSSQYMREGHCTYEAFGVSGTLPISSRGEVPFQSFSFVGREREKDVGDEIGANSLVTYVETVYTFKLDQQRLLDNPDGRNRRIMRPSFLWVQGESCTLTSGSIRGREATVAAARIVCTTFDSFEYAGAGDDQTYLFITGANADWLDITPPASVGPLGDFIFTYTNMTTGRVLATDTVIPEQCPANEVCYVPLEYDLKVRYGSLISSTNVIKVELTHQAYSRVDNGKRETVGGLCGFSLVAVTPV